MSEQPTILVIEDEAEIANLLRIHLRDQGFEVHVEENGRAGLARALEGDYALILLDLMLPGMDGLDVCRRIRQENRKTPIVMLTSRSEELDKVLGLELGADDYVTKPFSIRELIARVRATLRRASVVVEERDPRQIELQFGDLAIHLEKRRVTVGQQAVDLTAKEFDLLALFALHPGRAFSRQELLDRVWGYQYAGYSHTVNSHINRLRGKIEHDPADPRFIKTVWGVGYRFAEPEEIMDPAAA
jgi:two-component system, OmpR family, alkaline phosphatase synthesis response regulator PhoP